MNRLQFFVCLLVAGNFLNSCAHQSYRRVERRANEAQAVELAQARILDTNKKFAEKFPPKEKEYHLGNCVVACRQKTELAGLRVLGAMESADFTTRDRKLALEGLAAQYGATSWLGAAAAVNKDLSVDDLVRIATASEKWISPLLIR